MGLRSLSESLGEYAKDTRLNLTSVLTPEGAPGLTESQIWLVALATAYATESIKAINQIRELAMAVLSEVEIEAAKAAAVIMAMNNVYYRTLHLAEHAELSKLPARLRMNIIAKPGIDRIGFEHAALGVSALAGCGMCIKAHLRELHAAGVSAEGTQSTIRIAAVIAAFSRTLAVAAAS